MASLAVMLSEWREVFAWPWLLAALPLPLLVRWLLPAARDGSAALKVPFGARLDTVAAAGGRSLRGGAGAGALAWIAWALLCVAAARPQQLGEAIRPPQVGRGMMLALDLSGSMSELDMSLGRRAVDRLTAAKAVLADFLDRRVGDRIGLVVFGNHAYVLAPLTLDLATVRDQLEDSLVGLAGQETAIGEAIGLAVRRLRDQPSDERVLILLTDGVNTPGTADPIRAAEIARDEGVRIHTIAFGGDGSMSLFGIKIPTAGGGAEVDEAALRRIAQVTGGRFFRAQDTAQLVGIYAEINRLEPVQRPGKAVRPRLERYAWPLGGAFVFALLAFAWPRRRTA
ncbi:MULTISPECIES: vWA domain-containing protein [Lysobacter]|uniref:VWA domain-containing protein n=1 Tax=Lysobacter gummosus TaxID=262324 RepID=A0ABY3XFY0_9GAMM|nr:MULTISPECIES: VWA domain-containing protein [Lysobacter]UJB18173.1 VWA domain-containing protein [Lysobacter capsici]UJQ28104.1 VWA domain-containing protein [Lysobacter gummosus]UNP30546.1 VWA domain-containing protein [Lysobacter gummosus]